MSRQKQNSTINVTAQRLRKKILAHDEGSFLGNEDSLVTELGASRNTVRQVARLLEKEGLLTVKRGINGGYYGSKPSPKTVEATVTSYLEMLNIEYRDVTDVSSALWIEVLRRAAALQTQEAQSMAEELHKKVLRLKPNASFQTVFKLENACRQALFRLIKSDYIELIFNVNSEFAVRRFAASPSILDNTETHRQFVRAWRETRLLELSAIINGDVEMGVMAAKHLRHIWHHRIWVSQNESQPN